MWESQYYEWIEHNVYGGLFMSDKEATQRATM